MKTKHLLLVAVALGAFTATADVTIRSVSEKDGVPWSVTYLSYGKVRVENLQGEASYVLWERGKPQMITVIPSRKTYMVIDKAQVAAQAKAAADQMKQAEAQLAGMPPAIRDMMKKNMPNMGTGKPLIAMKLTKTGQSATKAGRSCKLVDLAITGLPTAGDLGQEFCVVPPESLGIPGADLETLRQMALFTAEMTKDLGAIVGGIPDMMEMGGWPVWTREKKTNGAIWVLKSIDRDAVQSSMFSVPAGYTEEKMPSMGDAMGDQSGTKKKKKKKGG